MLIERVYFKGPAFLEQKVIVNKTRAKKEKAVKTELNNVSANSQNKTFSLHT